MNKEIKFKRIKCKGVGDNNGFYEAVIPKEIKENYLDSRTSKERIAESKIKSTTTTTQEIKEKIIEILRKTRFNGTLSYEDVAEQILELFEEEYKKWVGEIEKIRDLANILKPSMNKVEIEMKRGKSIQEQVRDKLDILLEIIKN